MVLFSGNAQTHCRKVWLYKRARDLFQRVLVTLDIDVIITKYPTVKQ